jgi:hypothetical protein
MKGRLDLRLRLPRCNREFDRTTASAIRTRTYPTISEYSRLHLPDNREATCLSACRVSRPDIPSTEYTSGVKSLRCSRQASRYLSFFCCLHRLRTLVGSWFRVDRHSVSVILTSKMHRRPLFQNPSTAMSPLFSFAAA